LKRGRGDVSPTLRVTTFSCRRDSSRESVVAIAASVPSYERRFSIGAVMMSTTIQRPAQQPTTARRVRPSMIDSAAPKPFTLDQELEPFGTWAGNPIWVPPKDSSTVMAETMLHKSGLLASREKRWASVLDEHRARFTQVREIDLVKASIRLPQGKFFVSVTEQKDFGTITDPIPSCVQTRLEEFLAGPGKQRGVKVYYLKPLCVEVGDDLILTTSANLNAAITKIQEEVHEEYRRLFVTRWPKKLMLAAVNAGLALPREIVQLAVDRRQKAIDAYQAKLEYQRRKTALRVARTHGKVRTSGCTFDEILALTNPLEREDVIHQYSEEKQLSQAKRNQLIGMAAGTVPWFVALSFSVSYIVSLSIFAPPVLVCDPAFVAEMPGSDGVLLKIGHFDEVGGVTHVEI
jgi:hypothetical protein